MYKRSFSVIATAIFLAQTQCVLSKEVTAAPPSDASQKASKSSIEILHLPAKTYSLAGTTYPRKDQWMGLFCSNRSSHLKEVKVLSSPTKVPSYGQDDVAAQRLQLQSAALPLCLIKGLRNNGARSLSTYYCRGKSRPKATAGSRTKYQIGINAGGASPYLISPNLKGESITYLLRHGKQTQVLSSFEISPVVGVDGLPTQADAVLWSGDLDGDGKADFLTAFSSRFGEELAIQLYLSSKAKKHDMVGLAAEFSYWPPDNPGC